MNISNNSSLQSSTLQNLAENVKNQQSKQSLTTEDKKAPASYEVTISAQALELSQVKKSSESDTAQNDQKSFLNDVFRGVKEQLSIASQAGSEGQQSIEEAGKVFQKTIDSIMKQTKGDELSEQQIDEIAKADDSFHLIVDKAQGRSESAQSTEGEPFTASQGSAGGGAESSGGGGVKKFLANDLNRDGKVSASELMKAQQKELLTQITNILKGSETGQSLNLQA